MQVVAGIVLLVKFVLAGVVGVRLLRIPNAASAEWLTPERCLGIFFIVANVLGGVVVTAAYGIWANDGEANAAALVTRLHAVGQVGICTGYAMVLLFTQRTFYPRQAGAEVVAWSSVVLLAISLLGRAVQEGFAISLDPGPFHWTGYGVRMFGLVWASWAAFRYWTKARRRTRLGLLDPLVANRFLLWGLWASGNLLTAFSEPIARTIYGWLTGADAATSASIQGVGGPIIAITLAITSALAVATTAVLFLAFFPTERYRRWIAGRDAPAAEGSAA